MMRLALRQHRLQVGSGFVVVALLASLLLWTGHEMTSYMHSTGLSACLTTNGHCDGISQLFENRYGSLLRNIAYLNFLPMLAGVFWGAPLVAREVEQGTYQLAWTQSVTRRRWLTTNLLVYAATAIVLATVFSLLLGWWFQPFASVGFSGGYGRMQPNVFDFQGIVPIAYTLYAFALGVAAGVLIRRTLPAMVVTFAGFLPLRLELQSLRAHFLTPLHIAYQAAATSPRARQGDWILHSFLVDQLGRRIPDHIVASTCQPLAAAKDSDMTPCLITHGFHQLDTYQPASRFWPFQGIEAAIFVGLAIILLAIATRWVTHRTN